MSVYGELSEWQYATFKEMELFGRYEDWEGILSLFENDLPVQHGSLMKPILPSPFNLGDKWYDHALYYIRYQLHCTDDLPGSIWDWREIFKIYTYRQEQVDQIIDETLLDVISDGIKLLGL